MSRYINYDALDYKNWHMIGKSSDFIDGVVYMAQRIEDAPSIDIVFCKGCKHYHELWGCTKNPNEYLVVELDDFCSRGERREP